MYAAQLDVAADDHQCRVLAPMAATPLFPTYNSMSLKTSSVQPSAMMNFMPVAASRLAQNNHLILDIDDCPMKYAELPSKTRLQQFGEQDLDSFNSISGDSDVFVERSFENFDYSRGVYFED